MKRIIEYLSLGILCATGVVLIALQIKLIGWILLCLGMVTLLFCSKQFKKDVFLLYISIGLLGLTPISTSISFWHIIQMGLPVVLALVIPYSVSRFIYKDYLVRFKFHHGRNWYKTEILYVSLTTVAAYFIIPFYFKSTGAHLNWAVEPGFLNLFVLFLGTNLLGLWDELFFISTALGILRRFFSFPVANLAQSILLTSFLYELGFRGWGFIMIFTCALIQGYVYKVNKSLFYVITIHLIIDFVLYLALIHAHHPTWMPIFFL